MAYERERQFASHQDRRDSRHQTARTKLPHGHRRLTPAPISQPELPGTLGNNITYRLHNDPDVFIGFPDFSKTLRKQIKNAQKNRCAVLGTKGDLEVHHIVPKNEGGKVLKKMESLFHKMFINL